MASCAASGSALKRSHEALPCPTFAPWSSAPGGLAQRARPPVVHVGRRLPDAPEIRRQKLAAIDLDRQVWRERVGGDGERPEAGIHRGRLLGAVAQVVAEVVALQIRQRGHLVPAIPCLQTRFFHDGVARQIDLDLGAQRESQRARACCRVTRKLMQRSERRRRRRV